MRLSSRNDNTIEINEKIVLKISEFGPFVKDVEQKARDLDYDLRRENFVK